MNAPATAAGSPVATYASISSSVTCAKRTWVAAERPSHTSRWVSMTQWPVCSTPWRPRICCQRAMRRPRRRLAEDLPVEREHGVAPDHEGARLVGRHRDRLHLGQLERVVGRPGQLHGRLVDPADLDLGVEPGVPQRLQPRRRRGGEDQPGAWAPGHPRRVDVSGRWRARRRDRGGAVGGASGAGPTTRGAAPSPAQRPRRPRWPSRSPRRRGRPPPRGWGCP